MSYYLTNVVVFLFIVYFCKTNRQGLHIFQLEHYYLDRYLKWVKENKNQTLNLNKILLLFLASLIFVYNAKFGYIATIIAYLTLILITKKKKEKKPFVITARVRRQFTTYLILLVLIVFGVNAYNDVYSILALNFIGMFSYLFVYIVALINSPIEKHINKKFCKKASRKIKEIPNFKVVGITGSYGKTSTKNVISTILSQKYNSIMTPESYNTTMGVVRTINEKITSLHQLFVCEMGAKYVGDIKEICDVVKPDYAVITAVGPQHLDTFGTVENVGKTKFELVDSIPEKEGIAFLNWEDENIRKIKVTKNIVKYGLNNDADYYAENIEISESGSTFDVVMPNGKISVKTKLLGKLNILNIVCGVAVANKLGLTDEQIKMGIKYIKPVEHRLELRPNPNGSIIIDDSYNSNIRGAKMALETLGTFKDRQRILITPGIVELGDKAYEINKELGKEATKHCDYIMLVGEKQAGPIHDGIKEANYPEDKVFVAKNLDEAIKKMYQMMDNKTVVLLENDLPDNYL